MTANDRRRTLKPEPIDESKIDFTALQERLSNWIQEDDSSEGE
jgi:predicted RNA-binding protein with RPS1 domain